MLAASPAVSRCHKHRKFSQTSKYRHVSKDRRSHDRIAVLGTRPAAVARYAPAYGQYRGRWGANTLTNREKDTRTLYVRLFKAKLARFGF